MDSRRAPKFLTFLCILSFIYGLFSVKSSVQDLFFSNEADQEDISLNINMDGEALPSSVQYTIDSAIDFWLMEQEYSYALNISTLALSILSIIGVFLMYKLNNKGFIIYTIANLLLVIIPFIYFFNNTVGQLVIASQFFITALFILLYATQLKYMGKNKEPLKL